MKRFDRLGSAAFVTVIITLVFHLIAMSFTNWREITCNGCDSFSQFGSWSTGITTRCYTTSMASIFDPLKSSTENSNDQSFQAKVCMPNQMLMVNNLQYASTCLDVVNMYGDIACSMQDVNNNYCKCDYLPRTKLTLGTTIITSFALGTLVFLSHLVAFVKKDYIVQWLIPTCYGLLFVAVIFILITLISAGSGLDEDANELRFTSTIIRVIYYNDSSTAIKIQQSIKANSTVTYQTKVGWCFGMEILAFYFSLISLVLYLIMFLVGKRPDAIKPIMKSSSECLLTLEIDGKKSECSPLNCTQFSNPKQILSSSCQINSLKLFFTNQEYFLDFLDTQFQSDVLLEEFFIENQNQNTIQIEIDLYNFQENDELFSSDMFTYLEGEKEIIEIFQLKINRWIQIKQNSIQFIDPNVLYEQSFKQIHLTFFCYSTSTFVHWILFHNNDIQEKSPCSTQIQIQSIDDLLREESQIFQINQTIISTKPNEKQHSNQFNISFAGDESVASQIPGVAIRVFCIRRPLRFYEEPNQTTYTLRTL
ncbi:unnamed protein product [Adineta ricciae]|uniref:Transmembrane protein n=1 Tax=Adineta ricciae TaxID=249248 RepID=A0A814DQL8_ADIRI|nr:unnamed protein product [Adineta ricciae]